MKIKTAKEYYLWNAQCMMYVAGWEQLSEEDREKWAVEFLDYKKAL